ncbi:MAG: cell envelope integrity protein TolA [Nanoarchaeota archaeon]|nr:cell envelope integrity protein TolA [Nanoarchaeota archaeon]
MKRKEEIMTYKRVVKKGGKKYTYYYHSYRVGDKVKKIYIGGEDEYQKWLAKKERQTNIRNLPEKCRTTGSNLKYIPLIVLIILGFFSLLYFSNYPSLSGKVVLDIRDSYNSGEFVSGNLMMNLRLGELIPLDSIIVVEQEGARNEFLLSDLVSSNANGDFYVENANISGSGLGYGFSGSRIIYPEINFVFEIIDSETSGGGGGVAETIDEVNETSSDVSEVPVQESNPEVEQESKIVQEESRGVEQESEQPAQETAQEQTKQEEKADKKEAKQEEKADKKEAKQEEKVEAKEKVKEQVQEQPVQEQSSSQEYSSPLTGGVILDNQLEGVVSKNKSFDYSVGSYEDMEIISVDRGSLSDLIKNREEGNMIISTDYSETEEGFGVDYLGDETREVEIALDNLNISAIHGKLIISLVYGDAVIASASKDLSVAEEENETLSDETIVNQTLINEGGLYQIKEIGNLIIQENSNLSLDLNNYFVNAISYFVNNIENISLEISNNNLIIIPENNFTGKREVDLIAYGENSSLIEEFNISVVEILSSSISKKQYKAIINRPVKWLLKVNNTGGEIELPKEARNITIKTGEEISQAEQEIGDYSEAVDSSDRNNLLTGNVIEDFEDEGIYF